MSEQDKGDGLLIGILAVLALLVIGGLGVVGFGFLRVSRMAVQERVVAEDARREALQQRDVAEAARMEAEAIRTQLLNTEDRAAASENAEPGVKPGEAASKEKQP